MLARTISLYQNAYSGLSKSTWLLSLVMLVNRSGTMVIPFMTIYLTSSGYSIGQAGLVMGIFGFGAVCGGFIGGRLTDRFGFQRVQWATLTGGGLLFMVLGQMKSSGAAYPPRIRSQSDAVTSLAETRPSPAKGLGAKGPV